MLKLVEDIEIGDKVYISEELFKKLSPISNPHEKLTVDRNVIGREFVILNELTDELFSGEARCFVINDGRYDYRFVVTCGTSIDIEEKEDNLIEVVAIINSFENGTGIGTVEGIGEVGINRLYIFNYINVGDSIKGLLWKSGNKFYVEANEFIMR